MATDYDAIIIGAGHNGLVCASYLARGGLKVLVLERRDVVGGAAVTEEIHPGFRASIFSYLMSLLPPKIIADMKLRENGVEVLPCSDMFAPLEDDDYIVFSADVEKTQRHFARFSKADAAAYPAFDAHLNEAAAIMRKLLWETPPDPARRDWKTYKELAGLAWRYRKIGDDFYRMADLLTLSAYDYVSRWFEDERIRAIFCYYASIGTFGGPKSPGSAYVILHHVMGEHEGAGGWGFIKGGMGQITQAMARYAESLGVEIRTGAPIARVEVAGDRALGVTTEGGDTYRAKLVASNASAKALFLDMLEPGAVPDDVLAAVRAYRTFSTAFKANIACERPPQHKPLKKALADGALGDFPYPTYVHVAPDVDYLERAYDDAKHGWYSAKPFITQVTPTIVDDSLAPAGKHVINLFGGHAPYKLRNAEWKTEKDNFARAVFDALEVYAPGFRDDVVAAQVLVPEDMEAIVNLPQGHIFHGEITPDQLFWKRPVPHYADYRTPIRGLYQCGSSAHPGGGVMGIPGHNAAREIVKDWKAGALK